MPKTFDPQIAEELNRRLVEEPLDAAEDEPLSPEDFLPKGYIEVGGYRFAEPTCYAWLLLERIAVGGLPYALTPTERLLYLLWVVRNQDEPAWLAALTQRRLPEGELASFAEECTTEELTAFATGYLPTVAASLKKKLTQPAVGLIEGLILLARRVGAELNELLFRWPLRRVLATSAALRNLNRVEARNLWRNTPPTGNVGNVGADL